MALITAKSRYPEYALILVIVVLGLLDALNFSGIMTIDVVSAFGVLLTTFGIYTLAYAASKNIRP